MIETIDDISLQKNLKLKKIKKSLQKNYACYVLLTCSHPSKDGKMQVELNYSGDEDLASYLINDARCIFNKEIDEIKNNY